MKNFIREKSKEFPSNLSKLKIVLDFVVPIL